jgi:hypothetical protein
MTAATQRKAKTRASRPAYLTLHGWALGTLIEHGAVIECPTTVTTSIGPIPTHGTALANEARNPFTGSTPRAEMVPS